MPSRTQLAQAIARGRKLKLAEHLLRLGSDPNHCVWAAAFHDDAKAIRLLLARKRDPELRRLDGVLGRGPDTSRVRR